VLNIYRCIEDWRGVPDPKYCGTGGPVFVQPAPDPNLIAPAMLEAARSVGIPTCENQNGRMLEAQGGGSITDLRVRDGKRQSVFRSYIFPFMDRPDLAVFIDSLVTRLIFEGKRVIGVEISYAGQTHRIGAGLEVVLSLGSINTPKILMQSGIGDQAELRRFGIPLVQPLRGSVTISRTILVFGCVWEYKEPLPPRNNMGEATFFWRSESSINSPDLQTCQGEVPLSSPENAARFDMPASGWTLFARFVQPKSRGRLRLTGLNPQDPIHIE